MQEIHICSCFKNEARYLREWIEFHRLVGVSKFYLYQNNSEDDYQSVLNSYIANGIVELLQWPQLPPINISIYDHCMTKLRFQPIWLVCIDCDEFLFSPKYATLQEAIGTLPQTWKGIAVNWRCFGSSGKEQWEDIPVIERFTWRSLHPFLDYMDRHVKSIVDMRYPVQKNFHIHTFVVDNGTFTELGAVPLNGGAHSEVHSSAILRINHYWCKSRQEWIERIASGKPDMAPGTAVVNWEIFDQISQQDVEDKDIQQFLPQLKEKLKGEYNANT
jgi:glycosyl transferase family 92